ncbi:MAG: DUF177 domain-containing protein [Elusimicrobia bacterium]|nr:DUF177 domain-containing protein [Elusimicrobiota bacterium]
MRSPLKISIREIQKHDGMELETRLEPREISWEDDAGARLTEPFALQMEFSVGTDNILAQGEVEGSWELECSRCLEKFQAHFKLPVEGIFAFTQQTIDMAEEIRQGIVLLIPPKPLCRAGCQGLCSNCGANKNRAPCPCRPQPPSRFQKLSRPKKLRDLPCS